MLNLSDYQEYPALTSNAQIKQHDKERKKLTNFLNNPGAKIKHYTQKLHRQLQVQPISEQQLKICMDQWLSARDAKNDDNKTYKEETHQWYQADRCYNHVMRIPFFLIGLDNPLKQQFNIDPNEEQRWLTNRKMVTIKFNYQGLYYYARNLPNDKDLAECRYYLETLKEIYHTSPKSIDQKWWPEINDFPDQLIYQRGNRSPWHQGQLWGLGPVKDGKQFVYLSRIDRHLSESRLRNVRLSVKPDLAEKIKWNNLLRYIAEHLLECINLSLRFVILHQSGAEFPFESLTPEVVMSFIDHLADNDFPDDIDYCQNVNILRRMTQDLGSKFITEWIEQHQVEDIYLLDEQRLLPITLSQARHLLDNCCGRCGMKFLDSGYDIWDTLVPIGYHVYWKYYGFDSHHDYHEIYFLFSEDEPVTEFCDHCITLRLCEGKALAVRVR